MAILESATTATTDCCCQDKAHSVTMRAAYCYRCSVVCVHICPLNTVVGSAKTNEPIKILVCAMGWTQAGPRIHGSGGALCFREKGHSWEIYLVTPRRGRHTQHTVLNIIFATVSSGAAPAINTIGTCLFLNWAQRLEGWHIKPLRPSIKVLSSGPNITELYILWSELSRRKLLPTLATAHHLPWQRYWASSPVWSQRVC